MAWLVVDDRVLATLEVAGSWRSRVVGVLGRDELEGALMLRPAHGVHTIGVRFALDVAYCDGDMRVFEVVTMKPNRLGRPRLKAKMVVEAPARSFERWALRVGDQLEVRE